MIQNLRKKIDKIDDSIVSLLVQRMSVVKEIGKLKQIAKTPIFRPEREKEIIERLLKNTDLNEGVIRAIFGEIFAGARNLEQKQRIAFLGEIGSYTHQAARLQFGSLSDYLSMPSISSVFNAVANGLVKYGVIPIENNTDGIIGETFDLFEDFDLFIVAEIKDDISHNLASLQDLGAIKKIYSKDIAFGQCRLFFEENFSDAKKVFVDSTAQAAKIASTEKDSAAICSAVAAKIYNLPILYKNIQDSKKSTIRFVVISDYANLPTKTDKTSILVRIPNKVGSLATLLMDFCEAGINLFKIESRSIRDNDGFFSCFFVDYEGHFKDERSQKIVKKYKNEIKWLGSYVKVF